jgi:hypothetical protein
MIEMLWGIECTVQEATAGNDLYLTDPLRGSVS